MWLGFLGCDFPGQAFQLIAIDHGVVDHAENKFFSRAATEPIDNVLYRANGDVSAAFECTVNIGAALSVVSDEAFLFKTPEDRADGGFLEGPGCPERFPARFCRAWAVRPNEIHHHLFDGTETFWRLSFFAIHCNATICSIILL